MLWITSERPVSVFAVGNRLCTQQTALRFSDYMTATLQFESGLIGRISANFACGHRHQHVVRVFGTDATFVHDDAGPRLHLTRDPAADAAPVAFPSFPATNGVLIEPFVSAILTDENLDVQTQELFDAISICVASDESLRVHSAVDIVYV
jgi:predicted dehydrogenase